MTRCATRSLDPAPDRRRSRPSRRAGAGPVSGGSPSSLAGGVAVALLLALGAWQVYRLRWKLDLIAAVDARVHAAPVAAPGPPPGPP